LLDWTRNDNIFLNEYLFQDFVGLVGGGGHHQFTSHETKMKTMCQCY
jgi:hypothetical protein